jgi:pyrroloquinoline quinone biosynthesis protein B
MIGQTLLLTSLIATSPVASAQDPYVVILGVAQDAGHPQAACEKPCCRAAFDDPSKGHLVAAAAIVDPVSEERWLLDVTPDVRTQLRWLDQHAAGTGVDGIFLTHAHIGHYTGLMHFGHEVMGAKGVPVYVMKRMRGFLKGNGPWSQLVDFENIVLKKLGDGVPVQLNERLTVTPLLVPHRDEFSETVGFRVEGPNHSVFYLPDIGKWAEWETPIESVVANVDAAFLDGTFYENGEIPGRDMAEIGHPFIEESLARFAPLPAEERAKIRFIHLNHTNPALDAEGAAVRDIEAAGFRVAQEGEKVGL